MNAAIIGLLFSLIILAYNASVIVLAIILVLMAPRRRLPSAIQDVNFIFKVPAPVAFVHSMLEYDRCFTRRNKLLFAAAEIGAAAIEQTIYFLALWLLVSLFGKESVGVVGLIGYLAMGFLHYEFTTPFLLKKFTYHCPDPENGPWKAS